GRHADRTDRESRIEGPVRGLGGGAGGEGSWHRAEREGKPGARPRSAIDREVKVVVAGEVSEPVGARGERDRRYHVCAVPANNRREGVGLGEQVAGPATRTAGVVDTEAQAARRLGDIEGERLQRAGLRQARLLS